MSSKDSGKQEPTILGVAEASVAYGPDVADGAARSAPQYRPLNLARLAEQGMLTQEGGRSSVAEDFRIIKRPLLRQARASGAEAIRHGNLIVVTSAMPGEGKTYCAINLAMSIAWNGYHGAARRCRRGASVRAESAGPATRARADGRAARPATGDG